MNGPRVGILRANLRVRNGPILAMMNAAALPMRFRHQSAARSLTLKTRLTIGASLLTLILAVLAISHRVAESQPTARALVVLQATTPGTAQTGHVNVSGTIRAGNYFGSGANLTGLNASSIGTGTLSDARLSSNVGLLNNTQGWIGRNNFSHPSNIFVGDGTGLANVNANLLDGLDSTAFLQSVPNPLFLSGAQPGSFVIRGVNTDAGASAMGVLGESPGIGVRGIASGSSGIGVQGTATAASGVVNGVFGQANSTSGRGVNGHATASSGVTYGVIGQTESTSGRGIYGFANADSGTTYAGFFDSDSSSGYGVFATCAGSYGIFGQSTLTTGLAYGGYFQGSSPDGYAGYFTGPGVGIRVTSTGHDAVSATTSATGRAGVFGSNTATSDTTFGGYFATNSPDGVAGHFTGGPGVGLNAVSTGNYGIFATTSDPDRAGIYARNIANSGNAIGGSFVSNSPTGYGVVGTCDVSQLAFGVYAVGDFGASGVKTFRIDHPTDPLNKYLLHYSTESPFPQNFYVGNVVTDAGGRAWVDLPDYFADINTNFKYQLTVIDSSDDFIVAKVSREIEGNRFQIRTSKGNVRVSWRVDADRDDLRIKASRPSDVREKSESERGELQHPEFYGMPRKERPVPPG